MKTPLSPPIPVATPPRRRRHFLAFSLVEVTLALGIVSFGLLAVVGVLPTALASGRQSFDQNRAAAIANTLFTSFRSQSFQKVGYLDTQFDGDGKPLASPGVPMLDLNSSVQVDETGSPQSEIKCYVSFLEGVTVNANDTEDTFGEQRRLRFLSALTYSQRPPAGSNYLVTMHFNNQPAGMVVAPVPSGTTGGTPVIPAQANQVELIVVAVSRPKDQYRFMSTVANRFH